MDFLKNNTHHKHTYKYTVIYLAVQPFRIHNLLLFGMYTFGLMNNQDEGLSWESSFKFTLIIIINRKTNK